MLNSSKVLNYIKRNLGFPHMFIELDNNSILEYVRDFTIPEWSHYFPDINTIGFNPQVASNKVSGKSNEYYITDPLNLEILGIVDIYWPQNDYIIHGHPIMGPMSMGELPSFALDAEVAGWVKQFSSFDKTFEFKHPNIVRISGMGLGDWIAIEYERIHPSDFSKITNDLQNYFLELALADIMIQISKIRKRYANGNLKTPYGEIPLEDPGEEGQTKKREILEKLTVGSLPNITLDIG
jgi:hypothetical protein